MTLVLKRRVAAIASACLLASAPGALAATRPYTIDDLLQLRTLGPAVVDSSQRWLVVATTAPWSQAPRYDLDWATFEALGQLAFINLDTPGPLRPLLPSEPGVGYVAGPFSPSGAKMAVFRLKGHAREMGVVALATGEVRWLELEVESAPWGRSVQWRSDDELIAIARAPGAASRGLGYGWQVQARLPELWASAARGDAAVTALGAGRYAAINPRLRSERLVAVTVSTGAVRALVEGEIVDLEIAPGGGRAAVVVEGEAIPVLSTDTVTPSTPWRRRRLKLVDLANGAVREPLPQADLLPTSLVWSPDGQRLLAFARPDGGDWATGSLREIDHQGAARDLSADGVAPKLTTARDGQVMVRAGYAFGQVVMFGGRASGATESTPAWRRLDGRPLGVSDSARLEVSDSSGAIFTTGDGVVRLGLGGTPRALAGRGFRLQRPTEASIGVRPLLTPTVGGPLCCALLSATALRLGHATLRLKADETVLTYAPGRGQAVVEHRAPSGVSTVALRTIRGDRPLLTLNPQLAQVDRPTAQPIRHLGPQGEALTSWLFRPAHAAASARLPVIVVPYPGSSYPTPPTMTQPQYPQFSASVQAMVGQGYAVITPSLPMSPETEPGAELAASMLKIVDKAAESGGVDPLRVAVWGQSFGGYAALLAATQSDRFSAVIASAPVSDLASFWAAVPPQVSLIAEQGLPVAALAGWAETGQGRMLGPPWRDPERWRRNSPLWSAQRIKAPLLLIQGDIDADPSQAAMMFQALARQNKDALWLTYHGEGHVVISAGNLRDLYARAFGFLADSFAATPSAPGGSAP
ncbi:prolyl oligopeptidase family serine peptidase [Caulobacter sp. DWP3-1-3b2]|uniref:alpha/beta hydrolase family protein n=1 Tax=Caulobacter sp. DWP3-1-3b2 TaxID=2804643 RepID=UPI003CFADE8F